MQSPNPNIPHLVETEWSKQLVVKGNPFLMRPGELQNSSLTSPRYMKSVWQKMLDCNVNTLLGPVTWEMIEPEEGSFDFSVLDKIVIDARKSGMHLVLLWFGSFKNGISDWLPHPESNVAYNNPGISTYVPGWVKTDPKRFPRAKFRRAGGRLETGDVLSVFNEASWKADAKAFKKLMGHLQEIDEDHSTVLMVQVENETGLVSDSRDGSDTANKMFQESVPSDLLELLSSDWENLHPEIKEHTLTQFDRQNTTGNWEAVFGRGPRTDEIFMAYHYARYLEQVASAGKSTYPIPHFTNVWMDYVGEDTGFPVIAGGGGMPGEYPSGGAVCKVIDLWMRFAPSLDFISPDVYLTDYDASCASYRHRNQPLFIPEQRRDEYGARRIWIAYGTHAALGAAPFGIDTLGPENSPVAKHFGLLKSVSAIVLEAQRRPHSSVGFCFDELHTDDKSKDPSPIVHRTWGDYEIVIERSFVLGKPGPGYGIVIHRGGAKFLLIGSGFQVRAKATAKDSTFTGILTFEEKFVADEETGELQTCRVLGGDETRCGYAAIMPAEDPDYGGFPIPVTIPAGSMIAEVIFYHISD